ncbi:MAG: sterol desaturase family protein [Altererythrobacter sp.]|nr:sterol desaturase family protein [Altererythrobacter sp.]
MPLLRPLFRYAFAPAFFLGFLGSAILLVSTGEPKWLLLPLLLAAIATAFAAEQILPYEPVWNEDRGDTARDALHASVNEGSAALSVAAVPLLAGLSPAAGIWPGQWSLWLQLALAILVADVGITLAHYASHKWAPLWRLHAVHHSVTRMYGFNGLMKHPLHQAVETAAGTMPLLVVGLPMDVAALLGFAAAIQVMLQHVNVDLRVGPLIHVWAVAPAHRHHHLASSTRGDVNFGLFTTLTDRLLGTFVIDRPMPRDGQVGIAGRLEYPRAYLRQLAEPFRRRQMP